MSDRPHYAEPSPAMFGGVVGICRICKRPVQQFGAWPMKRWHHVDPEATADPLPQGVIVPLSPERREGVSVRTSTVQGSVAAGAPSRPAGVPSPQTADTAEAHAPSERVPGGTTT